MLCPLERAFFSILFFLFLPFSPSLLFLTQTTSFPPYTSFLFFGTVFMEQQFECGDHSECIEVRQDAQGRYYSQLNDIQDAFPGAARFRVEGKGILFLEDDNGQR